MNITSTPIQQIWATKNIHDETLNNFEIKPDSIQEITAVKKVHFEIEPSSDPSTPIQPNPAAEKPLFTAAVTPPTQSLTVSLSELFEQ